MLLDLAVIILSKHPKKDQVKSRIANFIGPNKAKKIYSFLFKHTLDTVSQLELPIFLGITKPYPELKISYPKIELFTQQGQTLGEKMFNSFSLVFSQGFTKAILIGCDLYPLEIETLKIAQQKLKFTDIVLGPSFDGGYYLIGLHQKKLYPEFFNLKSFGHSKVFRQTLQKIQQKKVSYLLLPLKRDIDQWQDLFLHPQLMSKAYG